MTSREQIIRELHVHPSIDAATEIKRRVNFLVEYSKKTETNGFVLGISGGVDSTLAGKLAQMAVDEMRSQGLQRTFIALRLPYTIQHDEADAQFALQFIKPDQTYTYNIAAGVDAIVNTYGEAIGRKLSDFQKGNVKARVRMITQYAIAGEERLLVIGTDQAAEAITGFYTKYGDGGADITPLSGLTKSQVRLLLHHLGADQLLIEKPPTADLLDEKPQQLDEVELGVSYESIDRFLTGQPLGKAEEIHLINKYEATAHKRKPPVSVDDQWWK